MKKYFKKLKSKPKLKIAIIIILLAVIIAICFMFLQKEEEQTLKYEDYTILKGHYGKIEKYDKSYTVEGYKGDGTTAYYIYGNIKANKDKDFTLITFNLYDKEDKLLGTAVAGLNELEKGKAYPFKALSLTKTNEINKIDHYKLKTVALGN